HYCDIEDVDVFISTYYTYPLYTKTVMMVHDMIPEFIGFDLTEQCWVQKHEAIRNASNYVCVSNNTAKDLKGLFPQVNPETVHVAPNAISSHFKPTPSEEVQAFLKEKGLEKGYYMFVGMRTTYKNAGNFFKAFLELPDHKEKAIVCVGPMPVENTLIEMMKDDDLRADWVSEEDLLKYYAGATALVYPSLYEGFGLPLLEAMACGCPVLTSKSGAMLEVGADAAMFFNPVDAHDIAKAMMKVREPETRSKMIEKGFNRIKDFSWKDTAEIIRKVLEKTAG
ncbi:MAG: glycosyltransferase family 4 protein, partial [Alphaproteobacteria bacterium]|nr:glycosyltransferase family 4 protein [Alphaproteobacteria bacterium]